MSESNFFAGGRAKIGLVAAACVVTAFGLGSTTTGQNLFAQLGISDSLVRTANAAESIAETGSNAVQAFLGRSPGERGVTDVLKGKAKRDLAQKVDAPDKTTPKQRALGKIFDDPLQSLVGPIAPVPVVDFLPLDEGVAAAALPPIAISAPIGSGIFSPFVGGGPSGGGFIGGGGGSGSGGGGSGGGGSGFIPPAAPPVAAAVPEPSTWILLLMGFAAVGASIRRTTAGRLQRSMNEGHRALAI